MVAVWALLLLSQPDGLPAVEESLARGQHQAALEQLSRLPERNAKWRLLASKAYDGLDDPARAVVEAEEALKLEPRDIANHLQLAQIFLSRNTPKAAFEIFSEAESIFPEAFVLRLGKGLALKELQQYDQAERELQWCLSRQPASALAFDALATIYLHRSKYSDARKLAELFLERNPSEYRGYYFLAAGREGDLLPVAETKQLLEKTLQRNPDFAAAHALLGKVLLREDNTAEAVVALKRAIELRPNLVQAHLHLANALRKLGDEAGAAREFETVRQLKRKEQEPAPSLLYRRGSR